MTAVWILCVGLMLLVWYSTAQRKQRQLRVYQEEIKALKQASGSLEQTLVRRGRRLDVLLSAVSEAVFRVDRLGRVMAANQPAQKIFGLDVDEEMPQSMLLFYRDSDWHKSFSRALKSLPEAALLPEMKVAGRVLVPRLAALGAEQALLLCVDMTDLYKLEAQRRTFLSNLMHDLKTPLTSLLGYARSLEQFGEDADFRKEAAAVIADEAKHVNRLLDALLTLDQIEFSQRDESLSCQWLDVLNSVCKMLQPLCTEKQLVLTCASAQSAVELAIADDELERILTNLMMNAVNYSPIGGEIQVLLHVVDGDCLIAIHDAGAGIPAADLSRVTERFYRVDQARTRKSGGHGLGLAIVKELVEKNRGQLTLSNQAEGGLLVQVSLPVK